MRELLELAFDVDAPACGLARAAVTECLRGHVAEPALETARLLVTELVANAVRHSRAHADERVIVRVWLGADDVRLEVDDPGRGGVVRLSPPSIHARGGFGLGLVDGLSQRWAAEHIPGGRTRVWADVARAAASRPSPFPLVASEAATPKPLPRRDSTSHETESSMIDRPTDPREPATDGSGQRPESGDRDAPQAAVKRARAHAHLERAHKTVNGISEALPGAPRSGSA